MMAMTLIDADVCRDGGSLVADFKREDGSHLSILLEVVLRRLEPGEPCPYGHLHVGTNIQNYCDPLTIVPKGSSAEVELLNDLDSWLRSVAREGTAEERNHRYVLELRSALERRDG